MNKKFLLAALALPMLFTACSEDELFEGVDNNVNAPEAKGFYMTMAPTLGDVADSRATWLDNNAKLAWDKTDLISVYWLDTPASMVSQAHTYGWFNSIFKTEDGNAFTSESMVFLGGNVAVYPGDTEFTNKGNLYVKVPFSQDATTINKTPYISNYLNVTEPLEGQENQLPGYNNGLYSPMKLAANVLYLNIELANIANLAQYNFKVDSVSLVTTVNKFTDKGKIMFSSGTPKDKGKVAVADGKMGGTKDGVADTLETITRSLFVANTVPTSKELTATSVTDKGNGKYQAKFVILPTQLSNSVTLSEDTEIVIYTNCGRINLTTTSKTGSAAAVNIDEMPETLADNQVLAGVVTGKKNSAGQAEDQTIAELMSQVLTSQVINSESSNFNGERAGMAFNRTIQADMKNATLNNSKVFNSDDIKNYVAIHTAMNSSKDMNLILSAREGDTFKSLTKEAIAAVDAKNNYKANEVPVTLSLGTGVTAVEIVGGGAIYNAGKSFTGSADLTLAAGASWTMDDKVEWGQDNVSAIINNGTLTVAGTVKDGNQNELNEILINNGTLKIGGNGILQVADKLRNTTNTEDNVTVDGVIEVVAGQDLVFNKNVTAGIAGIINVAKDAFVTVAKDISVISDATINNNGTVSSIVGNGGWTNNGVINVLNGNAITYVQKNANGVIKLFKRDNEVVVKDTNQGKIVYEWADDDGASFMYLPSDKYTYVVFDANQTPNITLPKKASTFKYNNDVSFEITNGTINLTVEDEYSCKNLYDLKVAKGATLQLYSGNDLTVHCLINEGNITIGGTITWNNTFDNFGVVRSVGNGAILAPANTAEKELVAALTSGNASLLGDVRTTETLNVDNKVVDGNGYTLSVGQGSVDYFKSSTLRFIEMNGGGTIKDLVIDGNNATYKSGNTTYGIRAVFLVGAGVYEIDGVIVRNVTYTINDSDATTKTLNVSNSTLEGWTSYGATTTAEFENVKFEVGPTQGTFRPHGETTLTGCSFEKGFVINLDKLSANGKTITLNNCYYDGVEVYSIEYKDAKTVVTLVNGIVLRF